jgi:hypothetical protein
MTLQFLGRCVSADRYPWLPPFDWAVACENEHWWNRQLGEHPWIVQVLEDGAEVARVEFDDPGLINPCYANLPELGNERLEIQYIEVRMSARERGTGTRVVRALENQHPDRRLFAYSEADRFGTRLGWEPFHDPRPGPAGRTLLIQPAG